MYNDLYCRAIKISNLVDDMQNSIISSDICQNLSKHLMALTSVCQITAVKRSPVLESTIMVLKNSQNQVMDNPFWENATQSHVTLI